MTEQLYTATWSCKEENCTNKPWEWKNSRCALRGEKCGATCEVKVVRDDPVQQRNATMGVRLANLLVA